MVKADNGTYGMGIDRARRQGVGRAQPPHAQQDGGGQGWPARARLIIQEGVLTQERMNDAVAEPVVYMMDRYVVGGLTASMPTGVDETSTRPVPALCRWPSPWRTPLPQPAHALGRAPNRFYMYGVIARLAMLAASYELEATNPDAENYD